ncbi:MAG: tyrosine-type recombinase/integrase [Deltaproteobacteria bacterium]|nr:tyrosine-type recombinase/integrase [Deltaproteobacteria bacterium]
MLRRLVEFLQARRARYLTCKLALEFATLPKNAQRFQWANRLRMVRGFARYRAAEDPRTEVPPPRMLPCRYLRRTPAIISDAGLERLLCGALALPSAVGLRPQTYWTLFGLLAATGMRPGEPLRLRDDDVDLVKGVVIVRESKGRTRLVPVHSSTALQLRRYRDLR